MSVDKSRITKQRRLLSEDADVYVRRDETKRLREDCYQPRRGERDTRERDELHRRRDDGYLPRDVRRGRGDPTPFGNGNGTMRSDGQEVRRKDKKERSLSPYSRRLALTQSMNVSR